MQGQATQVPHSTPLPLRDIHLPEAVSWWPPAIGWWLLMLLIVGLLWAAWAWLRKRRLANEYRIAANAELESHYADWLSINDSALYLQAASEVLKRVMQHLDSDQSVLSLSGQAWVEVLSHRSSKPLSEATQAALAEQLYQRNAVLDIPAIHVELIGWINDHDLRPKEHSNA